MGMSGSELGPGMPRRTSRHLSKFEFTRAVGVLALQLSETSDALKVGQEPLEVARSMILARHPPLVFRRYLPDGTHEDCSLQCLEVESLRVLM